VNPLSVPFLVLNYHLLSFLYCSLSRAVTARFSLLVAVSQNENQPLLRLCNNCWQQVCECERELK